MTNPQNITIQNAKEMIQYLPLRPNYSEWIQVISAIGNYFDENDALDILLSRFTDEKSNEHSTKLRNKLHKYSIGTFVHLCKEYGYKFQKTTNYSNENIKHTYKVNNSKPIVRVEIKEFLNAFYKGDERIYRLAINKSIIDKNLNAKTLKPNSDFIELANNFENVELTLNEIADCVISGFALLPCQLNESFTKRKSDNFKGSELILIDIDNTKDKRKLTLEEGYTSLYGNLNGSFFTNSFIEQNAILVYTTCNSTDEHNRFRVVFELDKFLTNKQQYSNAVKNVVNRFNKVVSNIADEQCKDIARAFYGNRNALIYSPKYDKIYDKKKKAFKRFENEN